MNDEDVTELYEWLLSVNAELHRIEGELEMDLPEIADQVHRLRSRVRNRISDLEAWDPTRPPPGWGRRPLRAPFGEGSRKDLAGDRRAGWPTGGGVSGLPCLWRWV